MIEDSADIFLTSKMVAGILAADGFKIFLVDGVAHNKKEDEKMKQNRMQRVTKRNKKKKKEARPPPPT